MTDQREDAASALRAAPEYSTAKRFRPRSFEKLFDLFTGLDPHFASVWLNYGGGLFARDELDVRTRLLVLTGQYTMLERATALEDTIEAAIEAGIDLREVLEAILQCYVYGGEGKVEAGAEVFVRVVSAHGRLDEVQSRGLPLEASHHGRDLAEERETWSGTDRDDPRLDELIERYGWFGLSHGLRLRPGQHINLVSQLDALDPEWCELWIDMTFDAMYGRGVLDDRTRILCIVADCIAVGDTFQYPRHMAGALRAGATPRELLEVILQSLHIVGHPLIMGVVLNDLLRLLDEMDLLSEVVEDEAKLPMVRRVVAARIAGRKSVADLATKDGLVDG